MKVLFFMNHAGSARNFELALRELAERGHEVVIALDLPDWEGSGDRPKLLGRLVVEHSNLSRCPAPPREPTSWGPTGRTMRIMLDYLRYLDPAYRDASRPRSRAESHLPRAFSAAARSSLRSGIRSLIADADRNVPISPEVQRFIREHSPDLVAVTPLVALGSPQLEYVRAARSLGIPSALPVAAWDNLTFKGGIHDSPDLVTVWNEDQRVEAVALHGIPPDRVVVTGAMAYDHWFDWRPTLTREEFCRKAGLDPNRPYVLYTASSGFIAPGEEAFLSDWVAEVRREPALRDVGILYRPHPAVEVRRRNGNEGPADVVVFPPDGADPQDESTRSDYFDSIFHGAAVVGINTSALIEATIVGRPVYTVITRYRESQLGTLHFRQLLPESGGVVHASYSLHDHARQLAATVADRTPDPATAEIERFITRFVRGGNAEGSSTGRLVDALERAAAEPSHPPLPTSAGPARRAAATAIRYLVRSGLVARRILRGR